MENKEIVKIIKSNNNSLIIDTLKKIKEKGNKDLIPEIYNLLIMSNDKKIQAIITDIFNNLKDQKSVPYLINAINNCSDSIVKNILVSACWKNGLNYSEHYDIFIDLIINSDFELAFEAHTVIDNQSISIKLNSEIADKYIAQLKSGIKETDTHKAAIINETINAILNQKED